MPEPQEFLEVGGLRIPVNRKDIKHVHIAVYPPDGAVTISAPAGRRAEMIRAFVLTRLAWIKARQAEFSAQLRQPEPDFITRESHYLWGRRYLLVVREGGRPGIEILPRELVLTVRPGATREEKERAICAWQRGLLRAELGPLIRKWEAELGVSVKAFFVQRLKTKWGSCTPHKGYVRFNLELVKKPKDLLEYVVAHELCHLLEPRHSKRFYELLERHYSHWEHARAELNELPVG